MSSLGRKNTKKASQVVAMMGKMADRIHRVLKRVTIMTQFKPETCCIHHGMCTQTCDLSNNNVVIDQLKSSHCSMACMIHTAKTCLHQLLP